MLFIVPKKGGERVLRKNVTTYTTMVKSKLDVDYFTILPCV